MTHSNLTVYNKICWEVYSNIFSTSLWRLILDFKIWITLTYFVSSLKSMMFWLIFCKSLDGGIWIIYICVDNSAETCLHVCVKYISTEQKMATYFQIIIVSVIVMQLPHHHFYSPNFHVFLILSFLSYLLISLLIVTC